MSLFRQVKYLDGDRDDSRIKMGLEGTGLSDIYDAFQPETFVCHCWREGKLLIKADLHLNF